ncbi:MAG: nucleoside 2-deoxyribosyltransferase [Oscillospiraceae bacterium]|nr:nucleoside 2-deoxyribosyltransferase [Oscillospiraceae bacterium]
MKKIYFAGSIRGGRADAGLYARMIDFMKEKGHAVLTEHVGHPELNLLEQGRNKDGAIYAQDTAWLRESELLIGECTNPSLGVGYELAYAERFGKPCYLFYNQTKTQLSAMLTGDPYFHIYPYQTENQLFSMLEELIAGFE